MTSFLWWVVGGMSVVIVWADTYIAGDQETGRNAALIWLVGSFAWPIVVWWVIRRTDPSRYH
jgi:hypothetical protein